MIGALAIRSNRRSNKAKVNKLRPQISVVSTTEEARIVRLNSSAIATVSKTKTGSQLSFPSILAGVAFVSGIIILVPATVSGRTGYFIAAFSCVLTGIIFLIYHFYHSEQIKKKDGGEGDKVESLSITTLNNNNNNSSNSNNSTNNNNELAKSPSKMLNVNQKLKSQGSIESRFMSSNELKKNSSQTNLSCDVAISMESTPYASRVPSPEMRVKTPYVRESSVTSAKGSTSKQMSLTLPPNVVDSLQSLVEEDEMSKGARRMSTTECDLTKQNVLSKSKDSAIQISTESSDSVQTETLKLPLVMT